MFLFGVAEIGFGRVLGGYGLAVDVGVFVPQLFGDVLEVFGVLLGGFVSRMVHCWRSSALDPSRSLTGHHPRLRL